MMSDTGATTDFGAPSFVSPARHALRIDKESLPTGMAMPSAGQSSSPTALTAAKSATSSPGSPQAAIQLAERRTSPSARTSAARMFVTASATASRAAARESSSATGVRSPMAIASPACPK